MYCRHTLPPYHFGDPHWACAHVAAFAGAVLGGVGAWAYAAKEKVHHHQPVHDWTVSLWLHPYLLHTTFPHLSSPVWDLTEQTYPTVGCICQAAMQSITMFVDLCLQGHLGRLFFEITVYSLE